VQTYLARDVPQLGISIPASTLLRFWTMLAHWHGQIWNAAEFARALGTGEATARRYLDLLSDLFLVRHPRVGASWEGWVIDDLINTVQPQESRSSARIRRQRCPRFEARSLILRLIESSFCIPVRSDIT